MGRWIGRGLALILLLLALALIWALLWPGLVAKIEKLFYPLPYRESISYYSRSNNLDPWLVAAVIRAESGFRPGVVSPKGARGLMQLMPETANWVAGQLDLEFQPEYLGQPDYNLRLGTWYLAYLRREFAGNTVVALAAYNAGRGNVVKWLAGGWDGRVERISGLPFYETREFISRVLADRDIYERLYGSDFDFQR